MSTVLPVFHRKNVRSCVYHSEQIKTSPEKILKESWNFRWPKYSEPWNGSLHCPFGVSATSVRPVQSTADGNEFNKKVDLIFCPVGQCPLMHLRCIRPKRVTARWRGAPTVTACFLYKDRHCLLIITEKSRGVLFLSGSEDLVSVLWQTSAVPMPIQNSLSDRIPAPQTLFHALVSSSWFVFVIFLYLYSQLSTHKSKSLGYIKSQWIVKRVHFKYCKFGSPRIWLEKWQS